MNPGDTSFPRAERRVSTAPAYDPPACTMRSFSKTTLPCSCTSWLWPLNATTQPPSMRVFMAASIATGIRYVKTASLEHFIRTQQERGRDRQAEGLRGFQVDDELVG